MYRRPKFLEVLIEIRQEMAREADYDVDLFAEIVRSVVCLRTGKWPERLKDAEELDVIEQQLANSEYVSAESKKLAIERAHEIDDAARQRGMGGETKL